MFCRNKCIMIMKAGALLSCSDNCQHKYVFVCLKVNSCASLSYSFLQAKLSRRPCNAKWRLLYFPRHGLQGRTGAAEFGICFSLSVCRRSDCVHRNLHTKRALYVWNKARAQPKVGCTCNPIRALQPQASQVLEVGSVQIF